MDIKEFKQELIQEILLNIQPSYYKNYELKQIEILSLSVFSFILLNNYLIQF